MRLLPISLVVAAFILFGLKAHAQQRPTVITYNGQGNPITILAMDRKPDGTMVLAGTHRNQAGELLGPCLIHTDTNGLPTRVWRYSHMFGEPDMVRALPNGSFLVGLMAGSGTNVEDFLIMIDPRGAITNNIFPDSAGYFGADDTPYFGIDNSVTLSGGQALVSGYRWHLYRDDRNMSFFYTSAGLSLTPQYQFLPATAAGPLVQVQPTQFVPYPGNRNEAALLAIRPDSSVVLVTTTPGARANQLNLKSAYSLRPGPTHERLPLLKSARVGNRVFYCLTRNAGTAPSQILATDAASGRQLWHAQTSRPGRTWIYAAGQNMLLLQNRLGSSAHTPTSDTIQATLFDPATGAVLRTWNQFGEIYRSGQSTQRADSSQGLPLPILTLLQMPDNGYRVRVANIDSAARTCPPTPLPPQTPFVFIDTLARTGVTLGLTTLTGPDNGFRLQFNPKFIEEGTANLCARDACTGIPMTPVSDTILEACGDPVRFALPGTGSSWTWSNGATGPTVSLGPGRYQYVLTTRGCGSRTDSVIVLDKALKKGALVVDSSLCLHDSLAIANPYADGAGIRWKVNAQDAGSDPVLVLRGPVLDTGRHSVVLLRDNGTCKATDSASIRIPDPSLHLGWLLNGSVLPRDTVYFWDRIQIAQSHNLPVPQDHWTFLNAPTGFDANGQPYWEIARTTRLYNQAATSWPGEPGCAASDTRSLDAIRIAAPNVLTLNQDGLNETLRLEGFLHTGTLNLAVRNRWGKSVFESGGYQGNWPTATTPAGLYFLSFRHPYLPGGHYKGWVEIVK